MSGCKSEIYDKNRKKTKREDLRKKWLNLLKHVRRKGGADSCHVKNPNKRICVCKVHFKNEDPTTSLVRGKKKVTPGWVPSVFKEQPVKHRSSHRRCSVRRDVLRNFAKFTGKDLCQSLYFNKVAGLFLFYRTRLGDCFQKQKATRPPPKDRLTSFAELETESDEVLSSSQSSSEKEPFEHYVEKASETERLIEENKHLRTKCECLQKKNNTRFFIRKFFIRKWVPKTLRNVKKIN